MQRLGQHARAVGVVRDVEHPAAHALEAAGKSHAIQRRGGALEWHPPRRARCVEHRKRCHGVLCLEAAEQRRREACAAERAVEREARAVRRDAHVVDGALLCGHAYRAHARLACRLDQRATHRLVARTDHRRRAALEHASFLARDRVERVAEQLGVIETDLGHARDDGLHNVRRVEPTAESSFRHDHVRAGAHEVVERHRRRELEERRAHALRVRRVCTHELDDLVLRDRPIGDDDALAEVDEVRRRVAPDA